MTSRWDAIVIGGGHNGLTCAAYLAKAGKRVLVLERRHLLGGAAVTEEIFPGYRFSACSYIVSLLRPQVIRDLELARFGLKILPLESTFTPYLDGRSLCRTSDPYQTREEIGRFSLRDADAYPAFGKAMGQLARFAKPVIDQVAPNPTSFAPQDLLQLLNMGNSIKTLGDRMAALQFKLTTMSAVDFLSEWFETDELIAPMACSGIIGTFLGVKSPGSAYVLLHHYMGEIDGSSRAWGLPVGGTGAVSNTIATAAKHFGATIRTEAPVSQIKVRNGVAQGVVLENGEEIDASLVVSGCDPRRTFLGFLDESELPAEFVQGIRRYKFNGSSGKVNLALDRLPEFSSRPGMGPHWLGDISIAPNTDALEKAYDEAKYGQFSSEPFMNIVVPTIHDRAMAPDGKHVMSIFVQYAPYHLADGPHTWPDKREAFGDAVINTLSQYMPDLPNTILHRQVLTPWDLEQVYGLTEGNIFHGELTLDQLLFHRPVSGWARFKTPVQGLWLCGSGAHPGGGVMGGPGMLAAQTILGGGKRS